MSRSTAKKTPTTATAAPHRRTTPSSSARAAGAAQLTSQRIAADLAAFKKAGGRIEVLGNTPLRPFAGRASATRQATSSASKAKKAAGRSKA